MTLPKTGRTKVAFLINLDRRNDRWSEFQMKSVDLEIPVQRFSAVDAQRLDLAGQRIPETVAACWMSHQEVAKKFLESSAEYCLILEDDVNLTDYSVRSLNKLWRSDLEKIDLLQVGFCVHSNRLSNRKNYKMQVAILKLLSYSNLIRIPIVVKILKSFYGYGFKHLERLNTITASMTFELGTHAYFISRNFAEAMIYFNSPVHLPADLAMMELANTQAFNSYRLVQNVIDQTDSPSSISNASANPLENLISKYANGNEN